MRKKPNLGGAFVFPTLRDISVRKRIVDVNGSSRAFKTGDMAFFLFGFLAVLCGRRMSVFCWDECIDSPEHCKYISGIYDNTRIVVPFASIGDRVDRADVEVERTLLKPMSADFSRKH